MVSSGRNPETQMKDLTTRYAWQLVAALATSLLVVMGSLAHAVAQAYLYY